MIDPLALRKLRHDRGLSQRRLAAAIGVDPMTVKRFESGADPGDWPLRVLERLAATLGVSTCQLLQPAASDPPGGNELAARVGGALLEHHRTTIAALATTLEAEISDIWQAVTTLDARLRPAGMSIARHSDEVWLCAPDTDATADGIRTTDEHQRSAVAAPHPPRRRRTAQPQRPRPPVHPSRLVAATPRRRHAAGTERSSRRHAQPAAGG